MDRSRVIARALVALMSLVAPLVARAQTSLAGVSPAGALGALPDALRARAEVAHASAELTRFRELAKRGMASDADLDDRRLAFDRARAEWLRTAIAAGAASRHIVIERAVKRRRTDGTVSVQLTLAPVASDSLPVTTADLDTLAALAWPRDVRNIVVSVKADAGPNGAAIGRPYERIVPRIALGARTIVSFELLQDATDIVVVTSVADRAEERRVRLENDDAGRGVSLRAAQFSIEGELGTEVTYDLTLEPTGNRVPALRLVVDGLPPSMRAEIRDATTKTRVVQLRMPEGTVAQRLQLAVTLPPVPTAEVHADSVARFVVAALADRDTVAKLALELIGRGVGRVELQPATLFLEAAPGAEVTVPVRVRNVGSRSLTDVALAPETNGRWDVVVRPARLDRLAAGETRTVDVRIAPPSTTPTGEYEVRLGVDGDGRSRGSGAPTEDRVLRVRVAARGGAWGTGALVAAFAVVGVALVAFGRRLVYR